MKILENFEKILRYKNYSDRTIKQSTHSNIKNNFKNTCIIQNKYLSL